MTLGTDGRVQVSCHCQLCRLGRWRRSRDPAVQLLDSVREQTLGEFKCN